MNSLALSFGNGVSDTHVILQELTLQELVPIFSTPVISKIDSEDDKKAGKYFVPCKFKGTRKDENVITFSGAAKDLDDKGEGCLDEVKAKLNGYLYFIYTTYSHKVKGERYRVFIPYSQPVAAPVHAKVNAWLSDLLGADTAADKLSQPALLPRIPEGRKADFFAFNTLADGKLFNPVSVLANVVSLPPPKETKRIDVNIPKTDGERTQWLTHTIGTMIAAGYNDAAIMEGLHVANSRNTPPLPAKKLADTLAGIRACDKRNHPERYDSDGNPIPKLSKAELEQMIEEEEDHDILTTDVLEKIRHSRLRQTEQEALLRKIKKKTGATLGALKADMRTDDEGEEPSDLDYARAYLMDVTPVNVLYCEGQFLLWRDKGVWERVDDRVVSRGVVRSLENHDVPPGNICAARVNSVTDLVRTEALKEGAFLDGRKDIINVLNGELHYSDTGWELRKHCREHYLTAQLPVKYDPQATAPRFLQFLDEVFAGDDDAADKTLSIMQMMGYSLLQHCRYEKFAILIGSGANGKSVLLEVMRCLVGQAATAAVQPSQFDNKFQRGHLAGKLVNIVTEIAEGHEVQDAELKAIVSGELTTAEHKFKPPFDFTPYCTCWFGTNHMPHTRDFSDALFRRALILTFNNKFEGDNCDPHLKGKLMAELPGILNLAIAALTVLLRDGQFTDPESSMEAKRQWRIEADQVAQFVEERCELLPGREISSKELYRQYTDWTFSAGINKKLNRKNFTSRLCRLGCTPAKGANGTRMIAGIAVATYVEAF